MKPIILFIILISHTVEGPVDIHFKPTMVCLQSIKGIVYFFILSLITRAGTIR